MGLHQEEIWVISGDEDEGLLQNCASNLVSTSSSKLKSSNNLCVKYVTIFHSSKGKTKEIGQSATSDSLLGEILHGKISAPLPVQVQLLKIGKTQVHQLLFNGLKVTNLAMWWWYIIVIL